jgi:Ankyrin repeats (3 copies)/Ankyrin repeat
MRRVQLIIAAAAAAFLLSSAVAGQLEDSLLASASTRLDVRGAEIAIRRGAKATDLLSHPDAPNVKRTPVQFVLSALSGAEESDAPQRAEQLLRALFKAGAKLTGERDELFYAIAGGHERILTLLLDQGANPHARVYGYLITELAIKYGHPKLLPTLYSRGLNRVDSQTTAQIQFVHAASRQRLSAMQAAIVAGAKVDHPDSAGELAIVQLFSAPLLEPVGYDVVKWMLYEAGADPNATEFSEKRTTALHKLIERNSYNQSDHFTTAAIAEMLVRKGAEVSAVDYLGRTPLHYAAERGNVLAMQVLIRNSAKVMARDTFKKTPMDMARSGEAISLLRAAGARE